MRRIAIIGGGISGLAAAFSLEKLRSRGVAFEYFLFEASDRFGGVIRTDHFDDCVLEAGPDSFLTEKPWAADLCRELGLEDQLIGSNDAGRVTYMLVKGHLVPIPDGLTFMVPTKLIPAFFSPLFSWRTKLRIVGEWSYRPKATKSEVTVAEFVEHHYGREMVDRVADPLLAGVYGGRADELSVQAVLPRFAEMEAHYGSLGKAMVAARKRNPNAQSKPLFTALKNGMQRMVDALLDRIPEDARRLNAPAEAARPEFGKWLVTCAGRTQEFDAAIISTPAYAAGNLLRDWNAGLAAELNAIPYSSSATIALGYGPEVGATLPPGFGFLVPRVEGRQMLAATFVHNKFPHRAPSNVALIRCVLGGAGNEHVLSQTDHKIETLVRGELKQILRIDAPPMFAHVRRSTKAMAQYVVGHDARVARIRQLLPPGLALAGNAYAGIGVPDCIRSGTEAATKILEDLGFSGIEGALVNSMSGAAPGLPRN